MNKNTTNSPAKNPFMQGFTHFANCAAHTSGTPVAFVLAVLFVVVWGVTGPIFKFSDTWQLVINTGTTIITFLMVFLIQTAQNRDNLAIQVKLNELLRALETANNSFVGIEKLTEHEVDNIRKKVVEETKEPFSQQDERAL